MILSKRQKTASTIASLIPHIIQGAHLGVFTSRSMTQTQFLILLSLHTKGSCTMGAIASHMKVQMPTVTGLVDRLVQAKYLKRLHLPEDRRQIMIELTPKAHAFLKQFQMIISKRWEEVLNILDEQELEQMEKIVTKLNRVMEGQKS
ncbi:MAG: MarR family transcriptional regulator [Candidatus Omnitrophota bacterium]